MGQLWSGKNDQYQAVCQCLSTSLALAILKAAHSPIFYFPISSDQPICQCFIPPKFPHVQY